MQENFMDKVDLLIKELKDKTGNNAIKRAIETLKKRIDEAEIDNYYRISFKEMPCFEALDEEVNFDFKQSFKY